MITEEQCAMVHQIVVDSGAAQMFNEHMRGPGGPKPRFDRAVYLIGWLLAVNAHQKSHIRLIHRVLIRETPLEWQKRWGVRWQETGPDGTVTWNALSEADLQNVSKRFRQVYNYTTNHVPDRKIKGDMAHVRERNYMALTALMDTLVRATLPARPPGSRDYALDATGIWATERRRQPLPTVEEIERNRDEQDGASDDGL